MHNVRILVGLAVAAAVPAQTIRNVAAGANLTQAFAAAAPGDVMLLAPGRYTRFALTKGLTVVGPAVIEAVGAGMPSTVVVPAGQHAHLIGLDVAAVPSAGHSLSVSGSVSLEDCLVGPGDLGAPVLDAVGSLVMQRCTLRSGGGGGLWVSGGTASLSNCVLHGQQATVFPTWAIPARPALHVAAGEVVCSSVTAIGGNGAPGSLWPLMYSQPAAPAIAASGAARVTLCDSNLAGGLDAGGGGAPAVANTSSFAVRHARSTMTGTNGVPSVGNVVGDVRLVGMQLDQGLRLGATSTATATAGTAQQLLAILGGFDATPATIAGVLGPVYGTAAGPSVLALAVPAAGAPVATAIVVPNAAGLIGVGVWLQALQFDGSAAWAASPVVGGAVH